MFNKHPLLKNLFIIVVFSLVQKALETVAHVLTGTNLPNEHMRCKYGSEFKWQYLCIKHSVKLSTQGSYCIVPLGMNLQCTSLCSGNFECRVPSIIINLVHSEILHLGINLKMQSLKTQNKPHNIIQNHYLTTTVLT